MEVEKSKQDKIKELFPKYVQRLTQGCGRLKCRNQNCCKNPNIKKLAQNEAAAQALKLVQNQDILNLNLCSDQQDAEPLKLSELKEIFNKGKGNKDMNEWNKRVREIFQCYNTLQFMFLDENLLKKQQNNEEESKMEMEEEVKQQVSSLIEKKKIPESGILYKDLEEFYGMVTFKFDSDVQNVDENVVEQAYLEAINKLQRDQANLDSIEELRFIVIFLANPQLFIDPQGEVYQKFLEIVNDLSAQNKQYLANWVTKIYNKNMFESVVSNLKTVFAMYFLHVEEGNEHFEEQFPRYATHVCQFFKIFFEANKIKPLVSNELFVYEDLQQYIDPKREYIDYYNIKVIKKEELFTYVDYTFLMNLSIKQQFLEIENEVEQRMTSRRQNGPDGLIRSIMGINLNLVLKVRRDYLLNDTLDQLLRPDQNYKLQLKVVFDGEQGIDEGGVQKEFFQLLTKQLFNLDFGMFVHKNKDTFHWFNGDYDDMPLYFELVGIILGLAIYNNILSDIKFPKVIYKKLLGQQTHISDIQEFDPVLYKQLMHILNYDESEGKLEDSMITFQISYNSFYMDRTYDLVPDGANKIVDNSNKEEYVTLYVDWYLNKHIEKQYNSFQKGFYKVTKDSQFLKSLDHTELQQICIGCETYDFTQLKSNTKYADGFTPSSQVVKWFWELILDEFTIEQQKRFLFFLSGSDRAPVQGLQRIKMIIVRQAGESEKLPSSSTCFNHLFLPEYTSKDSLRQKLLLAMENAEGFGLL